MTTPEAPDMVQVWEKRILFRTDDPLEMEAYRAEHEHEYPGDGLFNTGKTMDMYEVSVMVQVWRERARPGVAGT
jgi:hypothetical protein